MYAICKRPNHVIFLNKNSFIKINTKGNFFGITKTFCWAVVLTLVSFLKVVITTAKRIT